MPGPQVRSSLANVAALKSWRWKYVIDLVDLILSEALLLYASDVHLLPTATELEVRFRLDGVLQLAGVLPTAVVPNVVARLKVLANMITYRTDIPQEGRI